MRLLVYYVVFVLVGMVAAYLIGRAVEQWSAGASLPVFLACFFFVFWAAWRLAVRVTWFPAGSLTSPRLFRNRHHTWLAGFPISRRSKAPRTMEELMTDPRFTDP